MPSLPAVGSVSATQPSFGSTVETNLILFASHFKVERNLDLFHFPGNKVGIQGHLILATKDITRIPVHDEDQP